MASVSIPYNFVNGTTANAEEVDANFNSIKGFAETALVQVDGSVKAGTNSIQDGAVTKEKILDANVTNAKLDYTTVPRITVSSTEPSSPKAGDVWVQI